MSAAGETAHARQTNLVDRELGHRRLDLLCELLLVAQQLGEVLRGDLGIVLGHVVLAGARVETQQVVQALAVGLAHLLGRGRLLLEQSMELFAPGCSSPLRLALVKVVLKRRRLRR